MQKSSQCFAASNIFVGKGDIANFVSDKSGAGHTVVMLASNSRVFFARQKLFILLVLAAGLTSRFTVGLLGHNFDFDSYRIVAELMVQGKNVYANTTRYNYGPVMFNLTHWLDWMAGHQEWIFRLLLVSVLSAADLGIFFLLRKKFSLRSAVFYFLNPVSIIITGYHNQFDNLAIIIGFWSVLCLQDKFDQPIDRRKVFALLILGFSLSTKHVLFAFPFWLAVKQRGLLQKAFMIVIPVTVFFASFLPYWSQGRERIMHNVFHYKSESVGLFYNTFVPMGAQTAFDSQTIWLLLLVFFAFVCRRWNVFESMLIYLGVLVATAPATANQYFVIPLALLAWRPNVLGIFYSILITLLLMIDQQGLPVFSFVSVISSYAALDLAFWAGYLLLLQIIWIIWRQRVLSLFQKIVAEVNHQLGIKENVMK